MIFLCSLVLTVMLVPQVIEVARKINAIDKPDERKIHNRAVPRLGGLAIALPFLVSILIFIEYSNILWALLAGFCINLLTGLIDDIWQTLPAMKFTGEILATLVFLLLAGVEITSFGNLVGTGPLTTGRYAIPVSIFCMVGVINALNMADGLDGLAGGISLIACMFLAWFSFNSGQIVITSLLAALMGSLCGFLYYNRHPARVFMGDTGSLVLGYVLSAICILMVENSCVENSVKPISMAMIMGLPIVDAILVMTHRVVRGRNPFSADNTHLHHRLMALGLSHTQTVLVICVLMLSCGVLAVLMRGLQEWVQFYAGVGYATLMFGTVYWLQSRGFSVKQT